MKTLAELLPDISQCEVVSLAYNNPAIKPEMMLAIVKACIASDLAVDYVDFDLQFSSLLQNLPEPQFKEIFGGSLRVYQPSATVIDFVESMMSSEKPKGFVIVDSLNTLQNLLSVEPTATGPKSANQRSAVLVSAMQLFARANSQTILILNLTKSRPKKDENSEIVWEREIVGGRMTRFKSDVILFANETRNPMNFIEVSVDVIHSKSFRGNESDRYGISLQESRITI